MFTRTKEDWRVFVEASPPIMPGTFEELWEGSIKQVTGLQEADVVRRRERVLDFGCGNGRLAMRMCELPIRYDGVDIHKPSIDFCTRAFAGWRRGTFQHLDVRHRIYNPGGHVLEHGLALPFRNATFDAVIAASVFTHTEYRASSRRCLAEIFRVLKPGGRFFCSWFRSPPNAVTDDAYRTVFLEEEIRSMLADFEWLGDGGGTSTEMHDQWAIFLRKPQRKNTLLLSNLRKILGLQSTR